MEYQNEEEEKQDRTRVVHGVQGGKICAFGRRDGRGRQDGDGGGLEEAGAWGVNEEEKPSLHPVPYPYSEPTA